MKYRTMHHWACPTVFLAFVLIAGSPAMAASHDRQPHPPPELEALAFLIGDWDLETSFAQADGTRRTASARLSARATADGFGLLVEESHPYGDDPYGRFASSVIYMVHPKTRTIVGASNNSLGNRKHYDVTVGDGYITIEQSGELFGGRQGTNRHTLFDISANRYALRLDSCDLDGKNCTEGTYSYIANRQKQARIAPVKPPAIIQPGSPRAVAQRYLERYAAQDLDALAPLLADDAVFQDSIMHLSGRDQIVAGLGQVFESLTIDGYEAHRWIESGPRLVSADGIARFRQKIQGKGELRFEIPMVVVLDISDGRIVRHLDLVDVPAYRAQLAASQRP